ncbi:MAG: diguanylate cyclase [Bradyrhizobiaceae bacterium]|nr:MAG: diguanylate cyclase [Bradyrhizobiaceae bacterium]
MKDLDAGLKQTGQDFLHQGKIPGNTRPGNHSLRRKLFIGLSIAIVCTSVLAANVILRSYDDYKLARKNLREIETYRLILDVANVLSAERGPSNSVLGADILADSALQANLSEFRTRSDAALDRLSSLYRDASGPHPLVPAILLNPVRQQLAFARSQVDSLTAIPRGMRPLEDVQSVIESMFKVIDIFQAVIRWKVATLSSSNPGLAAALQTGQMLGDLREYGGRLASQIMAPIAVNQKIPLSNLVDNNRTRGRLEQIWQLIGGGDSIGYRDPLLASALHEADRLFFGDGLRMTDALIAQGRLSGNYTMSAADYTSNYVRTLVPLERLRTTYLDITIKQLAADQNRALVKLSSAIAVTTIILAILIGLVLVAQKYIFGPLLVARDEVISLAEDRPTAARSTRRYASELKSLFDAIDILRNNLAERASLTRQLKHQAETDGLTGLMNRRALDLIGESQTSNQVMANGVCLILMDIDHFKAINDTHGHLVGDQVLNETVCVVRNMLRSDDIFARYGGEEFILMISGNDLAASVATAKRIRRTLEAHPIPLPDGGTLNITSSFGVASGHLGRHAWPRLLEAADKALYRAKADGRNCVRFAASDEPAFAPDQDQPAPGRLAAAG